MDALLSDMVGQNGCAPDGSVAAGNPMGSMVNMLFEGGAQGLDGTGMQLPQGPGGGEMMLGGGNVSLPPGFMADPTMVGAANAQVRKKMARP